MAHEQRDEGHETQRLNQRLGYERVVHPHPLRRELWTYDKAFCKRIRHLYPMPLLSSECSSRSSENF